VTPISGNPLGLTFLNRLAFCLVKYGNDLPFASATLSLGGV